MLLKTLKNIYRKISLHFFGNTIGVKPNLLYSAYLFLLNIKQLFLPYKSNGDEIGDYAKKVAIDGYAKHAPILSKDALVEISEKIDHLFSIDEKIVKTHEEGGLIRLKSCLVEVPELEKLILNNAATEIICTYFGSPFKVFGCDVYRTVQAEEGSQTSIGSLKYHFDNCPSALFKVMIYLTDTKKETGALTVVSKSKSLELKNRGFWDRNKANSFQEEIQKNAIFLEGEIGTTLFFSTHYCIHKATLPEVGHRDVAVFLVQPSFVQQRKFTAEDNIAFSFNFGYCVNPFNGKPLRYGYE